MKVNTVSRKSHIMRVLSPFRLVTDSASYPQNLLNSYITRFSTEAHDYNGSFDASNSVWNDISDLTDPVHVSNMIYRLTLMAVSYNTAGMTLYKNYPCSQNILRGFLKLSTKYNANVIFNSNHYSWDIEIPNALVNLISLLERIFSGNYPAIFISNYKGALDLIVEGFLTLLERSKFIESCTDNPATWSNDVDCPISPIVMELQLSKIFIFTSLAIGDLSTMRQYYQRINTLLEVRQWNYESFTSTNLYDGLRADGAFQEYYSSVIPGSSAYNMISLVASIIGWSNEIIQELAQSGSSQDVNVIASAVDSISSKILTFIHNSILPFTMNGAFLDQLSGAQVANDSSSLMNRKRDIIIGIMQLAYGMMQGSMSISNSEILKRIYCFTNHLLGSQQLLEYMTTTYNFPIIGEWNKSTGIFLSSPIYPGVMMLGHYILPFGDRYVYNSQNFSVAISMNSYRTRNFQCIKDLNKLGFYQAAGAVLATVQDHPEQHQNFILFASKNGYMGTTADTHLTLRCSLQKHLHGTLSKGKFVSSITDGEHGSATIDYYNTPENTVHYRTVYLIESFTQGVHVAQLSAASHSILEPVATIATIPYLDGDTIEYYLNGVKKTSKNIPINSAIRILVKVTPQYGRPYAVAILIHEGLPGRIQLLHVNSSYTSVGGSSSKKITTNAFCVYLTLLRTGMSYTDTIVWNARHYMLYSYYPYLPFNTTDKDLEVITSKYKLILGKNDKLNNPPLHSNTYMSLTMQNSTHKIIALSFFIPSAAILPSGVQVSANASAHVLITQTLDKYLIILRDPILASLTNIRIEITGLPDISSLRHWCNNAGVVGVNTLVIQAVLDGSKFCQVEVIRNTPQPIPPINPPSPTDPPYIPPNPTLENLTYDNSTNVIVTPEQNKAIAAKSMIIITVVIVILLIIVLIPLIIFLRSYRKTAKSIKKINGETQKVSQPRTTSDLLPSTSHWEQSGVMLESTQNAFSTYTENSTVATPDLSLEKPVLPKTRAHRSIPSKLIPTKKVAPPKNEDSDGVANDSFDSIPIQYAKTIFG